jgi:hypothetical protein
MDQAALQRSKQKKLEELRKIRGATNRKESLLSKNEKAYILECTMIMRIMAKRS